MPIQINGTLDVRWPTLLDQRSGKLVGSVTVPYDTTAEALAAIPDTRRAEGLVVFVRNGSDTTIIDWWQFQGGILDTDLKKKDFGGGGGSGGRFGIEDNTGVQDRVMDMENHYIYLNNVSEFYAFTGSSGGQAQLYMYDDGTILSNINSGFSSNRYSPAVEGKALASVYAQREGESRVLLVAEDVIKFRRISSDFTSGSNFRDITVPDITANINLPLSVSINGGSPTTADEAGNIDLSLSGGGPVPGLQAVTEAGNITDRNVIVAGTCVTGTIMAFNQIPGGPLIEDGFRGIVLFDKSTGKLSLSPSFASGVAGDTPMYTSPSFTANPDGTVTVGYIPEYEDDAAADADTNLASGTLYKLTGGRGIFQKP